MSAIVLSVKVSGISPPVWRELLVPEDFTFHELHAAIQLALRLDGFHLYQFSFSTDRHVVHPALLDSANDSATMTDAHLVTITEYLSGPGVRALYQFAEEAPWELELEVIRINASLTGKQPVCAAGAGAGLLDDCGGPAGFMELLRAQADPSHPEYHTLRQVFGGDYNTEPVDLQIINEALELTRLLARRIDDDSDREFMDAGGSPHVTDELFPLVDRFALLIRPSPEYFEWHRKHRPERDYAASFRGQHDRGWVFLLPEFSSTAEAWAFVRKEHAQLMKSILGAAFGPASQWPHPFDWEIFNRYFDLTIESHVYDWDVSEE